MSKPLITCTLGWHFATLPPCETTVLAIDANGEFGEASHDGKDWSWSFGHRISAGVACWAALPDGKAILALRDAGDAARATWEITPKGLALLGEGAP